MSFIYRVKSIKDQKQTGLISKVNITAQWEEIQVEQEIYMVPLSYRSLEEPTFTNAGQNRIKKIFKGFFSKYLIGQCDGDYLKKIVQGKKQLCEVIKSVNGYQSNHWKHNDGIHTIEQCLCDGKITDPDLRAQLAEASLTKRTLEMFMGQSSVALYQDDKQRKVQSEDNHMHFFATAMLPVYRSVPQSKRNVLFDIYLAHMEKLSNNYVMSILQQRKITAESQLQQITDYIQQCSQYHGWQYAQQVQCQYQANIAQLSSTINGPFLFGGYLQQYGQAPTFILTQ